MLRLGGQTPPGNRRGHRPDPLVHNVVAELMGPPAHGFSPRTRAGLLADEGRQFYSHPEQSELAPLVYRWLQVDGERLPPGLQSRLQHQARQTMERNALLLSKLREICARYARDQIAMMVIKGPALADVTAGLLVRPFHDLDLLVRRHQVEEASQALRSLGFAPISTGTDHDYHRIFAHPGVRGAAHSEVRGPVVVELHFGLGDSQRAIAPDIAGIWQRSVAVDLAGCLVRTPDVTDHLLLTMMQLPHHDWRLRLLVDAGLIISRWRAAIGWDDLLGRARAWGMWALAASTLYTLDSMFGVTVPEVVRQAVRPEGYLRRAQWYMVMETVGARLAGDPHAGAYRLARLLVLDRANEIGAALARRIAPAHDPRLRQAGVAGAARRVAENAGNLPALARILLKSMNGRSSALSHRSVGSVHGGER